MKLLIFNILCALCISVFAQEDGLPYRAIPDYPADFTSGNIVARTIDGLGFRYYWASEGLSPEELAFKPTDESRSILETMTHILGLSATVLNAAKGEPNTPVDRSSLTYEELRKQTLETLWAARELMINKKAEDFENMKVMFQNANGTSEYPYWNMLNGPLSDAIYHTGQITTLRRTAGNPINPNISVFIGKLREN